MTEENRNPFTETMAAAYIASLLTHDAGRETSMITGVRGTVKDNSFTNTLQVEIVGEWLDVTVTVSGATP